MIQWFPGHMAKALKNIKEKENLVDLFIVVLDARAPFSSYNEELDKLAPKKPRLFVISKKDYGDQVKLAKVPSHFNNPGDKALILNLKEAASRKKILKAANDLLEPKRQKDLKNGIVKPRLRAMVVGVPNSGKSTLINLLTSSSKAKVGNMPGVTRGQQWVNSGDILLLDTPGVLWPKFDEPLIGVKLAVIGSIKIDIIPKSELFSEGYKLLSTYYPEKISSLGLEPASEEEAIYSNLQALCEAKNFRTNKNALDLDKGMNWFFVFLRDLKGVTYD